MTRHYLAAAAALVLAGCATARPQPLAELAPISGHSPKSVSDALDVAASSLASQGFRVRRDDGAGTVTGTRGQRRESWGAEVHCNLPLTEGNKFVLLRIALVATPRDQASTLRVEGTAQVTDQMSGDVLYTDPSRGCVSTGLAEQRVARALGLAVPQETLGMRE